MIRNFYRLILLLTISMVFYACSSTNKKVKKSKFSEPVASSSKKSKKKYSFKEGVKLSSVYKSMTTSATNNSQSSKRINREKITNTLEKIRSDVQNSRGKTKLKKAKDYMAAQALLGSDYSTAYTMSRIYIDESRKLGSKKPKIEEQEKLNMATALLRKKNITGATFLIEQLISSSNKTVSASAYNLLGVISIMMNRSNLAAADFKSALKKQPSHEAARMNLGYLSLKYGKYTDAKKYLSGFPKDWFALSGLATASYHLDDTKSAQRYCDQALKLNPKSKTLYFNCGLQDYYITGDTLKVRKYFDNATKISGSSSDAMIDEKIYLIQGKIEEEIVRKQELKEMNRLRNAELAQQKKMLEAEKKAKAELIKKQKASLKSKSTNVDDLL